MLTPAEYSNSFTTLSLPEVGVTFTPDLVVTYALDLVVTYGLDYASYRKSKNWFNF